MLGNVCDSQNSAQTMLKRHVYSQRTGLVLSCWTRHNYIKLLSHNNATIGFQKSP